MAIGFPNLDEHELREIKRGLDLRLSELKGLKNKNEAAGLSTADVENHMAILEGGNETPGLLYLCQSQLDAIFQSDLKSGKRKPPARDHGEQLDHHEGDGQDADGGAGATNGETDERTSFMDRVKAALADEALMHALEYATTVEWGEEEWDRVLTPEGVTDDELRKALGASFGKGGSKDKDSPAPFAWRGGRRPAIWLGQLNFTGPATLDGDLILAVVRERWGIPVPSLTAGNGVPEGTDAPEPPEATE